MKKTIVAVFALAVGALLATPAFATETGVPLVGTCLKGFYVNPDEALLLPEQKPNGLLFEGKDLIHHATGPIDFADFDKTDKSFTATKPGKVVFKAETSGPYSNLVINADGKLWSTAFLPEAVGGQNQPVAKAVDLIGKPASMKPGKTPYTAESRVVTFGVGYWVEAGDTVVTSISFHGRTYDLDCKPRPEPSKTSASPKPTVTPSATASATVKPTPSGTATVKPTVTVSPSPTVTTSPTTGVGGVGTEGGSTGGGTKLPVTGPSMGVAIGAGVVLLAAGVTAVVLVRRRRTSFTA